MVKAATLETQPPDTNKAKSETAAEEAAKRNRRATVAVRQGAGDSGPWTEKTAEDDDDSTTTAQRQRHAREATGPLTGTKQIHAYVHSTQYTAPAIHHQAATARDIRETMSKHAIVATEDEGGGRSTAQRRLLQRQQLQPFPRLRIRCNRIRPIARPDQQELFIVRETQRTNPAAVFQPSQPMQFDQRRCLAEDNVPPLGTTNKDRTGHGSQTGLVTDHALDTIIDRDLLQHLSIDPRHRQRQRRRRMRNQITRRHREDDVNVRTDHVLHRADELSLSHAVHTQQALAIARQHHVQIRRIRHRRDG